MKPETLQAVLISGPSGSGKTSLARVLATKGVPTLDLDDLGYHAFVSEQEQAWVVRPQTISEFLRFAIEYAVPEMAESRYAPVMLGWCNNMLQSCPALTFDFDQRGWTKRQSYKPVAYSLNWACRYFMVYDPTEEQLDLRFGSSRENSFGKSAKTRDEVRTWVDSVYRNKAPRGFVRLDVTNSTLDELSDYIRSISLSLASGMDVKPIQFGETYGANVESTPRSGEGELPGRKERRNLLGSVTNRLTEATSPRERR